MLGHRRPGVTETYAEFDPAYPSKGREAIDAYFSDLGIVCTVPTLDCVSAACHPGQPAPEKEKALEADLLSVSKAFEMVGATGIEPVTPTMST